MDMSKLPRLSQTPPAAAPPTSTFPETGTTQVPVTRPTAPVAGIGAEVWFSAIIGVIFLLIGGSYGRYQFARLTHRPFHYADPPVIWQEGPKDGREVEYWELTGGTAWSDRSLFLFGVALEFDAACLAVAAIAAAARKPVINLSLLVMVSAVALNVATIFKLYGPPLNIMPLASILAVALGGYSIFYHVSILRSIPRGQKS